MAAAPELSPPVRHQSAPDLRAGARMTREWALQQARAEGLTLRKADNRSGYANVNRSGYASAKSRISHCEIFLYQASVRRSGEFVHLGDFVTAEEAALCVARSRAAAEQAKPPRAAREAAHITYGLGLTREEALQQAQAEGLALRKSDNASGYANVSVRSGKSKPYLALVTRAGKILYLGSFATAEEAALCLARSQAAAKAEKAEKEEKEEAEAEEAAEAEEEAAAQRRKPCCFATAEEAVRCAAQSPSGGRAGGASLRRSSEGDTGDTGDTVVEGQGVHEATGLYKAATSRPALKEEMVLDASVKEEGMPAPLMP